MVMTGCGKTHSVPSLLSLQWLPLFTRGEPMQVTIPLPFPLSPADIEHEKGPALLFSTVQAGHRRNLPAILHPAFYQHTVGTDNNIRAYIGIPDKNVRFDAAAGAHR